MFLHKTLEWLLFNKKIGLMRSTDMRPILRIFTTGYNFKIFNMHKKDKIRK